MELPDDQDDNEGLVLLAPKDRRGEKKHKKHKKHKKTHEKKHKKDRKNEKTRRDLSDEDEDENDDHPGSRGCGYGRKRRREREGGRVGISEARHARTRSTPGDLVAALEHYRGIVGLGERDLACAAFLEGIARAPPLALGDCAVACTRPGPYRARNLAFDAGCAGYVEPFERKALHRHTNRRVTTFNDTMLIQETFRDPLLRRFGLVIVDDFQQRGMHTDLLVSLLVKVQAQRPDLRVVIFTATEVSAELAAKQFQVGGLENARCALFDVRPPDLQCLPRRVMYLNEPTPDYVRECADAIAHWHAERPASAGNILVFLPSGKAAATFVEHMQGRQGCSNLELVMWTVPGSTMRVGPASAGWRKCIVAISIIESSVGSSAALHHVSVVVDSMFTERTVCDSDTGAEGRGVVPVTREEAEQRGKFSSDLVLRICSESAASALVLGGAHQEAEVARANLATLCLQLKRLHVRDVAHFPYVTAPPARAMARALDTLHALEAIDDAGELTTLGLRMARFLPLDPALGRMLVLSLEMCCAEEALTIVAMLETLEGASLFARGNRKAQARVDECVRALGAREGDLVLYVNIYRAFEESSDRAAWCERFGVHLQALKRCKATRDGLAAVLKTVAREDGLEMLSCCEDADGLVRCVCRSFFLNAARLDASGRYYVSADGRELLEIPPSSLYFQQCGIPPPWIVTPRLRRRLRDVTSIPPSLLLEVAPHVYQAGGGAASRSGGPPSSSLQRPSWMTML